MAIDDRSIEVVQSNRFIKELKRLGKRYNSVRKDIQPLIEQLQKGETPGDRITGNKYPVYKVRIKNSDVRRGKSGGYRVIYYVQALQAVLLTNIYSKSDLANISNEEIESVIEQYILEIERQGLEVKIESESSDVGD